MTRPSVLFINRVYPPMRGASGRMLKDLAEGFALDGWHVTVLTTGQKNQEIREAGVRVVRVKATTQDLKGLDYVSVLRALWKRAKRMQKRDVVVTLTDPPLLALIGRSIQKKKKSKHIHWCHDTYPDLLPVMGYRFPKFMLNFIKSRITHALKKADYMVAIGRCMEKKFYESGIDKNQISYIPNWADQELFSETQPASMSVVDVKNTRALEEQLRAERKFRILYAGNIGKSHPMETVLDAAHVLSKELSDVEFVFVGDGVGFEYVSQERGRRRLDNIRTIPYQPQARLRAIMESGDVHIISLDEKATGLAVPCKSYAGLAAGRPCVFVGSQKSETSLVLKEFSAGVTISHGNVKGFVNAIKKYRLEADAWYSAHEGALSARDAHPPKDSIAQFIKLTRLILD